MKDSLKFAKLGALALMLFASTGCFRVGSETRALRDAALEGGLEGADAKIEISLGRLVFAAANFGLGFVPTNDIPPEARQVLGSVKGAEVSVYRFERRTGDLAKIMAAADRALEKKGCERLVGVLKENELVAVYVPKKMRSARNIAFHVLVMNRNDLVCVGARGDAATVLELAMAKAHEEMPPPKTVALRE